MCLCFRKKAQAQGIEFEHSAWREVLKKAQAEKKMIFLDCYTEWCKPCKQMVKEVFPKEKVGEFFNRHFISVAMDMEKGEGPRLLKIYALTGYPTFFFLNDEGDIVYKCEGFQNENQLLEHAEKALASTEVTKVEKLESFGLQVGDQVPDFTYSDVNGKQVSLSDLRGKYVYIDFWATWCSPCCAEIQPLMELEKNLHHKNICFVSISCDKDVEKWKAKVKEEGMTGIQLNTGGDKNLMKAFAIRGIPRFVLLDPEGKVVNPEMTRPSQKVTLQTLQAL